MVEKVVGRSVVNLKYAPQTGRGRILHCFREDFI